MALKTGSQTVSLPVSVERGEPYRERRAALIAAGNLKPVEKLLAMERELKRTYGRPSGSRSILPLFECFSTDDWAEALSVNKVDVRKAYELLQTQMIFTVDDITIIYHICEGKGNIIIYQHDFFLAGNPENSAIADLGFPSSKDGKTLSLIQAIYSDAPKSTLLSEQQMAIGLSISTIVGNENINEYSSEMDQYIFNGSAQIGNGSHECIYVIFRNSYDRKIGILSMSRSGDTLEPAQKELAPIFSELMRCLLVSNTRYNGDFFDLQIAPSLVEDYRPPLDGLPLWECSKEEATRRCLATTSRSFVVDAAAAPHEEGESRNVSNRGRPLSRQEHRILFFTTTSSDEVRCWSIS